MRLAKKFYFLIFVLLVVTCKLNYRVYTTQDCRQDFRFVGLNKIATTPSDYDGQFVEVSGYYYWGSEQSSLCPTVDDNGYEKMIWVSFDPDIAVHKDDTTILFVNSLEEHKKVTGKRIRIRGIVDAGGHGHLGQYAATIKNICYLEY